VVVALLDEKDERFKNLFGKAALFVLFAALGIGLVLVLTGVKKDVFTAKSPIYFIADSGQDLKEGMPVKFSGFKIGKLNKLSLDEQGRVQVEVMVDTKYLKLIHEDAVISLIKEGVIGDGVLEISRGTEGKPTLLAEGKVIFMRAGGLEQAVVDVKDRVMPILDDIYLNLHDPKGDIHQILKNLNEFSAGLVRTQKQLNKVLENLDKNMDKDVTPLLHSVRQSAENAEAMTNKLNQELPELLKKVDSSMDSVRSVSETINEAVKKSAPQIPGMVSETRATIGKTQKLISGTQEVVDSLNSHWPLKSDKPVETDVVKMDSKN